MSYSRRLLLVLLLGALFSCSTNEKLKDEPQKQNTGFFSPGTSDGPGDVARALSTPEPRVTKVKTSRYGNPKTYNVAGKNYTTMSTAKGYKQQGIASWYGKKFHGRLTSSREKYDMYMLTAAHRSLPIPTYARVTNLDNGKSLVVRINDRGPFHENRIIDLSYAAAVQLDVVKSGTARVEVTTLSVDDQIIETKKVVKTPLPKARTAVKNVGTYLQLGAFSIKANANVLGKKVAKLIPGAPLNIVTSADNKIHTLRLGPIRSKPLVDQLKGELIDAGISGHTVIVNQP